jgi:predicted RNA binding protein YcfA (HicA-like mRNA interferase family)
MLFTDISSERAIRAFEKAGFRVIREGKHIGMSDGTKHLIIPRHNRLNPYTLKTIIRDAGLADEQFKNLL